MLTCAEGNGSVVVSQLLLKLFHFYSVAVTGGPLGCGGGDLRLGQSQPDTGWGSMSEIMWHCVVTLLSLMCISGHISPIVWNLSVIIPNTVHASLLRNNLSSLTLCVLPC